ncbi:hypothetical protein RQP46_008985 [Phenoliferia psychrophenolica]
MTILSTSNIVDPPERNPEEVVKRKKEKKDRDRSEKEGKRSSKGHSKRKTPIGGKENEGSVNAPLLSETKKKSHKHKERLDASVQSVIPTAEPLSPLKKKKRKDKSQKLKVHKDKSLKLKTLPLASIPATLPSTPLLTPYQDPASPSETSSVQTTPDTTVVASILPSPTAVAVAATSTTTPRSKVKKARARSASVTTSASRSGKLALTEEEKEDARAFERFRAHELQEWASRVKSQVKADSALSATGSPPANATAAEMKRSRTSTHEPETAIESTAIEERAAKKRREAEEKKTFIGLDQDTRVSPGLEFALKVPPIPIPPRLVTAANTLVDGVLWFDFLATTNPTGGIVSFAKERGLDYRSGRFGKNEEVALKAGLSNYKISNGLSTEELEELVRPHSTAPREQVRALWTTLARITPMRAISGVSSRCVDDPDLRRHTDVQLCHAWERIAKLATDAGARNLDEQITWAAIHYSVA